MPDIFTTNEHEWLNRRYTTVAGIACLIFLGLLAACGGGNTDPVATTAPTAATSTASEGKLTILAVPPGWGGRVPGFEVINGITVPPEPAPSVNNATIVGVDLNGNGVRDDVERAIAKSIANSDEFTRAVKVTKAYLPILQLGTSTTPQQALTIQKGIICTENSVGGIPKSVTAGGENNIQDLLFNTPQRRAKQSQLSVALEGVDFEEGTCD